MNNALDYVNVTAEIVSVIINVILIYGNNYENSDKSDKSKLYSYLVFTNIIALIADIISWLLEGSIKYLSLLYICPILSNSLVFILLAQFALYLYAYIKERHNIKLRPFKLYLIFCSIAFIATVIEGMFGLLFTYQNGFYEEGKVYGLYVIISLLSLLFLTIVITISHKILGLHDSIAAYLYVLFPALFGLMNYFYPDWSFVFVAATYSLLTIYIMLQSEHANKLEKKSEIDSYYACHDELTGLYNRRAFMDALSAIANSDKLVGVVFTDVNGLKYINDHFGHSHGDKMLIKFSVTLKEVFRKDEIYRISGDEFVVLLPGISETMFEKRLKIFKDKINHNDKSIAAVGYEYGAANKVNELLQMSETNMYVIKQNYYKSHPELKRL